jgi:hypothetical protein
MNKMVKGILILFVCLVPLFFGCSNGDDGSSEEYPYAEYYPTKRVVETGGVTVDELPHIYIYFDTAIVNSYTWVYETVFTITVEGVQQSFRSTDTEITPPYKRIYAGLNGDLPSTGDIKISYNGGGVLAGKLEAFTDLPVSRKN